MFKHTQPQEYTNTCAELIKSIDLCPYPSCNTFNFDGKEKTRTISGALCSCLIYIFILASFVSRGFRFFILAGLLRLFGKPAKRFIEDNFTLATSIIGILLVLGVIIAMSI